MARPIPEKELRAIEDVVRHHADGASASEIADALPGGMPRRTLQYRLRRLVESGRLVREGKRRGAKYRLPAARAAEETAAAAGKADAENQSGDAISLSEESTAIRNYLRQPLQARQPVGYNRDFLDSYRPGVSFYLSEDERARLAMVGTPQIAEQPAGTFAKHILNRLLIDLSWNSSRLEGNTYSRLDTRRLIEFGKEAEGRDRLEAQMILNHKGAVEFLVSEADYIDFNRYTILNLHSVLAANLLADELAAGRLRTIPVGIGQSVFHPLEAPQLIEECFDQILATAAAIEDPFEKALFFMVQLPYLQPFDDVNKRVSRLAANIPLIRNNLAPLSFTDVPRGIYAEAVLGVYEMNRIDLLKDVFIWACERSAARYAPVRQSLGEPDPFRFRYREAIREVVGEIVRRASSRKDAFAHVAAYARRNVEAVDREKFREVAENELLTLHEGNYARHRIRPAEFEAWRDEWSHGGSMFLLNMRAQGSRPAPLEKPEG